MQTRQDSIKTTTSSLMNFAPSFSLGLTSPSQIDPLQWTTYFCGWCILKLVFVLVNFVYATFFVCNGYGCCCITTVFEICYIFFVNFDGNAYGCCCMMTIFVNSEGSWYFSIKEGNWYLSIRDGNWYLSISDENWYFSISGRNWYLSISCRRIDT